MGEWENRSGVIYKRREGGGDSVVSYDGGENI